MEKAGQKTRDIRFFSEKNGRMVCVHIKEAREYTRWLECQSWVVSYECNVERYQYVNPIDIRKEYFSTQWGSDFLLHYADGRIAVREIVSPQDLDRRAVLERLEFSRRYWKSLDVDWKSCHWTRGRHRDTIILLRR